MKTTTTLALAATVLGSAALLVPAAQAESFSFHYSTGPSHRVVMKPAPMIAYHAVPTVVHSSHPAHKPAWHPKYKKHYRKAARHAAYHHQGDHHAPRVVAQVHHWR